MKKIFLIPAFIFALGTSVFAANGDKIDNGSNRVSSAISKRFNVDFKGAENVTWTASNNFQKAEFTLNGEKVTAFYKFDGDFMGLTHQMSANAIPAKAMQKINQDYKGYAVGEVILYQTNEAVNPDVEPVAYFVDLKNDAHEVLVRITSNTDLELFKQIK